MKNFFALLYLMLSCSPVYKNKPHNNSMNENIFGQRHELHTRNFSEIPISLLKNIHKMGMDNSFVINEYEGKYLNFIFKINPQTFNLAGKKVHFLVSKKDYFTDTRCPDRKNTIVGGSSLYIFNSAQKSESGGYDAAITYWDKYVVPIDEVINRLKKKY